MKFYANYFIFMLLLWVGFSGQSCKHQPIPPDGSNLPCDADVVYFNRDILPILNSNCAQSGCHDASSQKEGINLTTYDKVMQTAEIKAGKPNSGEFFESISSGKMPPSPNTPLTTDQKALIEKWITQGAKNLTCKDECDTTNVTYTQTILPIIEKSCKGCHSTYPISGGIDLSTYEGVKAIALNGQLYGSVSFATGFSPMPKGGGKLSDCQLLAIDKWIKAGAPQN